MRFYPHTDSLGGEMTRSDWQDKEAKNIADDAEAFNRSYSTITTEQADDLARALSAIQAALGRMHH